MQINIKLLTKTGCSLCQKPIFILKRLKTHYENQLRIVSINIDNRKEYEQYFYKVPVILINEKAVCEMKINESLIRQEIENIISRQ